MSKLDPDAVNHWDLPVTEFKPRKAVIKVVEPDSSLQAGPDVEQVLVVRRKEFAVFDFYRHRPDRAESIRRYS